MALRSMKETGAIRFATESAPVAAAQPARSESPHQVCRDVQRNLLAHPALRFSSLVIRRTQNGVCLEGMLESNDPDTDVCSLAQQVSGVNEVINRLLVRHSPIRPPRKG